METEPKAPVAQIDGDTSATASFVFDRLTVERFRKSFPRARWSDEKKAWIVPGKTASRRVESWLAQIEAEMDRFADAKGRDAFEFDPIASPYLEVATKGFRIRTPYSRTVVSELRAVPFSQWDGDLRLWHVPFRSVDDLRRHWKEIEAAAIRNEPAAKKARQVAAKGSEAAAAAQAKAAEKRKRRYPVPEDDLPPLERPVATGIGIVVMTGTSGEVAEQVDVAIHYPWVNSESLIWATWRRAEFEELVGAWPAKAAPSQWDKRRGWWLPTIDELRPARREAKSRASRLQRKRGAN
jgi:hypothetical protein